MQSLQVLRLASRYIAGTGNRARDLAFGCGGMCVAGCRCEYGAGHAGRIALVWHAQQAVLPLPTPRVGCEHPFVAEGGWCYFSRWALPLVKLLTFRMGAARAFCTSPGRRRLGHQKPRARRFVHGRAVHHASRITAVHEPNCWLLHASDAVPWSWSLGRRGAKHLFAGMSLDAADAVPVMGDGLCSLHSRVSMSRRHSCKTEPRTEHQSSHLYCTRPLAPHFQCTLLMITCRLMRRA